MLRASPAAVQALAEEEEDKSEREAEADGERDGEGGHGGRGQASPGEEPAKGYSGDMGSAYRIMVRMAPQSLAPNAR